MRHLSFWKLQFVYSLETLLDLEYKLEAPK